jgi:hypothetical protein
VRPSTRRTVTPAFWQYTHIVHAGEKHLAQFNNIVREHTAYFVVITGPSYWISKADFAGR